ncbi:AAA family ATPase [Nocardia sp. NPDC020380]|uniref:AAA family ATPase n=1 Tax=Nocardia sp. NPDC020380 TaxID=3364309 RepID=UPI0037A40130
MTSEFDRRWNDLKILTDAIGHFEADPHLVHHYWRSRGDGEVVFLRFPGRQVLHVLGRGVVAAECLRLLADSAVKDWRLQPMAEGATPLQPMAAEFHRLTGTVHEFNMLMRAGFTTVEELAATPDGCLRSLPNSGAMPLARIREFLTWWRGSLPQEVAEMPGTMKSLLRSSAKSLDGQGILAICGFPASGKSTAAQFVASITDASVLDKDDFAPTLEQAVMARLTENPFDRDSQDYKTVVAPGIYEGLVRVGFTIARQHPIVLDAPFLSLIHQAAKAEIPLGEHLRRLSGASSPSPVVTVWMDCSSAEIRSRMTARGEARDAPKLADWDTYQSAVLDGNLREIAHSVVDLVIPSEPTDFDPVVVTAV